MYYFVVRRQFHSSNGINMLFNFVEKIIPSSDNLTLVLIVDEIQFIALPRFTNLNIRYALHKHPYTVNLG